MPVPPATTITGTSGDDILPGTAGNDVIDGLQGNDQIDGGSGSDWVTYQGSLTAVEVFLGPNGFGSASGGYGDDNLTSIENVVGSNFDDFISASSSNPAATDNVFNGLGGNDTLLGGRGNDTLYGGDGQDNLYGQQGDDVIDGEGGNDFIRGGSGNDTLIGGSGFDRVSFFPTGSDAVTGGVTVSLLLQGMAQDTGQGIDTLIGIEALSGTPYNDSLTGDNNTNWLVAADFDGAGGDDQLYGLGGEDLLEVAAGNHLIDGGANDDTLSFNALGFELPNGVSVSLLLQGSAQDTGLGSMTIVNVEHLSGTPLNDSLTGDGTNNALYGAGGDDVLTGGAGTDSLYGDGIFSAYDPNGNAFGPNYYADASVFGHVAGNDLLEGGTGNDYIDGGDGNDTASYANAAGSVSVTLGLYQGASSGADGTDYLLSIENVIGSSFNDTLRGNGQDNQLYGGGGNDILSGGGGFDILDGGDGVDTVDYSDASGPRSIFLNEGDIPGGTDNDEIRYVENAIGTAFNDRLFGNSEANRLEGGAGADLIYGRGGNDSIYGGDGDDQLRGDGGDDLLDGGSGQDRVSYFQVAPTVGAVVNLTIQGVAQNTNYGLDTLVGIEHVSGTTLNDVLTGNDVANWLWDGGDGNASVAASGNDVINAGGGDDLVEIGNGNDTVTGGTGIDTLSFLGGQTEIDANGVTFSLALQGAAQSTEQGTLTASGFENASGSIHDDVLSGNGGDNILLGDWGNDTLSGGDGNDSLYGDGRLHVDTRGTGGSGPITLFTDVDEAFGDGGAGVDGNDVLIGGKGNDSLYGGRGDDVLTGDQGADSFIISAMSGADRITDFKNVDTIVFDSSSGVDSFGDLTLTRVGSGTLVTWGTTDSLLVEGVRPNQLNASDFDFVAAAARVASVGPDSGQHHGWYVADHGIGLG